MDERLKNGLIIAGIAALVSLAAVVGVRSFQGPAPQVQRVNTSLIDPNDKTSDSPAASRLSPVPMRR